MTGSMKTPGVYIVEKDAFPNSVVEVATAVPAFVGYTEKADNQGKPLSFKPWRITSMAEYQHYFGAGPVPRFAIDAVTAPSGQADFTATDGNGASAKYRLRQLAGKDGGRYLLYAAMLFFFQNGGGPCYIVSVGDYGQDLVRDRFDKGIDALLKEREPTMLAIPEAVLLTSPDCAGLQQKMLSHCGYAMKNRVAILDIQAGDMPRNDPGGDPVRRFREDIGSNFLDYGAAYYPWLNTRIVGDRDIDYRNIASADVLRTLLRGELKLPEQASEETPPRDRQIIQSIAVIGGEAEDEAAQLHNKTLSAISPLYRAVMDAARTRLNRMPPSAAMAGLYTMVDNTRGVWKAPANVSVNAVVSPAVAISSQGQEDLNITTSGKSVNAIRSFPGEGVLVWGARTLDGNSLDWRYINVRRTEIMLRQSIELAVKAYVFEPNIANTWVTIKSMIANFLTGIWKRGGLAGATPEDAFSVHCGLGETMTPEDIQDGVFRITVLVALVRPAEFIKIEFQQKMQES